MSMSAESIQPPPGFERTSCPKCQCTESRVVAVGQDHLHALPGKYAACECKSCGLWFLNPRPTPERLRSLYPSDYAPHANETEVPQISRAFAGYLARSLGYQHLADHGDAERPWRGAIDRARFRWKAGVGLIPHYVPGGALLEIGAASGARLRALRQLGWEDLRGIELVPAAAERARDSGFAITCGSVEEAIEEHAPASLDVVVSSMVIEHLADPFALMRKVAEKLKPGGELVFSTITRDSLDARIYGSYWGGFDFPRHLVFLRDRDIDDMVSGSFETLERHHHVAPQDFVRSSEWRRGEGRWFDRAILSVKDEYTRYRLGLVLAWTGQTCRISYRCRRPQ